MRQMLFLPLTSSSRTRGMLSGPQPLSQPSRASTSILLPTGQGGTSNCMAIPRPSSASPQSSMLSTCNSISINACCSTYTSSSSISNRYSMLLDTHSMRSVWMLRKYPLLLPLLYTLQRIHRSICPSIMRSSSSSDGMQQCPALLAA